MRVAHFLHRAPPEYSGAAIQGLALIEALGEREDAPDQVLIAFSTDPERVRVPAELEPRIVRLGTSALGKLRHRRELRRAIQESGADILHVHGYFRPAVRAGLDAEQRLVLKTTMHGVDDLTTLCKRSGADRRLLARIDRVVSLSPLLSAANQGDAQEVLIPNGIDPMRWSPPADHEEARGRARESLGISPSATLFLYTGGGYERKGVRLLPALWRRIRTRLAALEPHLVLLGEFLVPAVATQLAEDLGGTDDVTLIPKLVEDLVPHLTAADALLFLSRREGLPNAVLEAVAMDLFVFALRIEGTYDGILDEKNSMVVDELGDQEIDRLGAALVRAARDGIDNAAIRERLDIHRIAERYAALYREVLAER